MYINFAKQNRQGGSQKNSDAPLRISEAGIWTNKREYKWKSTFSHAQRPWDVYNNAEFRFGVLINRGTLTKKANAKTSHKMTAGVRKVVIKKKKSISREKVKSTSLLK